MLSWEDPRGGSRGAKGAKPPKRIEYNQGQFVLRADPSSMGAQTVKGNQIAQKNAELSGAPPACVWKKNTKQGWPSAR